MKWFKQIVVVLILSLISLSPVAAKAASVNYQGFVAGDGWQNVVSDGATCGTTGQNKRLESIKMHLSGADDSYISYSTHIQDLGWTQTVNNDVESGTPNSGKQIEAVKIKLNGPIENQYDVYYRSHVSDLGWLGWAKNEAPSGTSGLNKKIEALEVRLVNKNAAAPGTTDQSYVDKNGFSGHVVYKAHVQDIGWMDDQRDGAKAGTEGQAKQLEALQVHLEGIPGTISTRAHVENEGWQSPVSDGQTSGTTGMNRQIEAVELNLGGIAASVYDVYYRSHCQDIGWLGWASNGASSGSAGGNKQMEAIEIRLIPKGDPAPGDTENTFVDFTVQSQPQPSGGPQPGLRTVKNFLKTALSPVGSTLYIWGGGWNEEDNGAGPGATTIGLRPEWKAFYDQNDGSYDYNNHRYEIMNGLDCSGYVGWVVYNTLNTESGGPGEVYWADDQASWYAQKGYGSYTPYGQVQSFQPGDIVSLNEDGHIYIALGQCEDGSVVCVHASPPGIMITGTRSASGGPTQATQLSEYYMNKYFPDYYNRYSSKLARDNFYTVRCSKFTWGPNFVGDPDGIRNLNAQQALQVLLGD